VFLYKAWFERWAPLAAAAFIFCACLYFRDELSIKFAKDGPWKAPSLYAAVFNWASIQSGFVFGIYGFIVTKKDGFIGKISETITFAEFVGFSRRAYIGGFALTFTTLPLLVAEPSISDAADRNFSLVSAWFAFFVWTFCAFLRVAFSFGIMAATPDRPKKIPG